VTLPGEGEPARTKQGSRQRIASLQLAPLVALGVVALLLGWRVPAFWSRENLLGIGVQSAVILILAIAQTLVIIAGGIDLSVGSVVALAGTVAALAMSRGMPPLPASLLGLAAGAGVGGFNGAVVAGARMPSFIVTLGTLGMARGLALILTDGTNVSDLPAGFMTLGQGRLVGVPMPILCVLAVALVAHLLLARTQFGRYCYAMGSNQQAARLSGVAVQRWTVLVFVLSGLLSGLGGIIQTSRLGIGQPTTGEGFELDAVAAAVIGGASLAGGEGHIAGTMVGALLMAVLRNGGNLLNLPPFWQQFIIGAMIIVAVLYDHLRRRGT
jgi:ribose transport system permease protein